MRFSSTPKISPLHFAVEWAQALLGHAKLDTTALYTQVATNVIRAIMSPLDRLTPLTPEKNRKDQAPA